MELETATENLKTAVGNFLAAHFASDNDSYNSGAEISSIADEALQEFWADRVDYEEAALGAMEAWS